MDLNLRYIYLPLLFVSGVLGYQIVFYFIYQYNKAKKEKLKLSRILLAYGLIFGILLSGFFIRVINLYYIGPANLEIFGLLTKITFILLYSAFMLFFIIISTEPFHKIISAKFTKTLAILMIIPITSTILFQIDSLPFIFISTTSLFLSYIYILFFHSRIVRLSTGQIKKRLNLIFGGFALCVIQHIIGGYIPSRVLFRSYSQILQVISAPIFICGLMIVFLGVFKFPAFLEFGWKQSLIQFLIINRSDHRVLYSFDFKNEDQIQIKKFPKIEESKLILSSGIIGIDAIISKITDSKSEHIDTIKQEDFLVLLNYGDDSLSSIIYCLIVNKDMMSFHYFLKTIKNKFQQIYKNILINLNELKEVEDKLFLGFDKNLINLIELD
ncbi:MAG: hypothetical protein ACFFDK_06660 [Promethearchaeota archaeon]